MAEKSLICPIEPGAESLERAMNETERFAKEKKLNAKKSMHLRLLCEELHGMIGGLLRVEGGNYWIVSTDDGIELHLSAEANIDWADRETLVELSTNKKNAAYAGVKGKMLLFLDNLGGDGSYEVGVMGTGTNTAGATGYQWSYRDYVDQMKEEEQNLDWELMEKSILSKLTKDIVVGVRNHEVTITLYVKE